MNWIALIVCLCLFITWFGWTYNRLITFRNRVREAWSGIDVQLKRRHDLIPNLVATVEAYASHESDVLEDLTRLRAQPHTPESRDDAEEAENDVSESLGRLIAVVERYPELRADANFRALQEDLVEIEDHLQYARRYYNGAVRDQNTFAESFPSNVVARLFDFESEDYFEVERSLDRNSPSVSLGDRP